MDILITETAEEVTQDEATNDLDNVYVTADDGFAFNDVESITSPAQTKSPKPIVAETTTTLTSKGIQRSTSAEVLQDNDVPQRSVDATDNPEETTLEQTTEVAQTTQKLVDDIADIDSIIAKDKESDQTSTSTKSPIGDSTSTQAHTKTVSKKDNSQAMEEGKHKDLTVTDIPQYKETKASEDDKPFVTSSLGPASSTSKPSK